MSFNSRIHLLRRFLRAETNEQENAGIDQWYYRTDDTRNVWANEGKREQVRQEMLSVILRRIEKPAYIVSIRRVAAAAVLAGLLAAGWWMSRKTVPQAVAAITVTAASGEIRELRLPDSSVIWLKSGTSIRYAADFGRDNREIALLEGEAFFDVRQQANHPFVVKNGALEVKVLGTSFNVQAYTGRPDINVWVEHGRVQVSGGEKILQVLTANKRLTWERASQTWQCDSLRWEEALQWQQGILLLHEASFSELARQLHEIYDLRLITDNAAIRRLRYDAKFFIKTPVNDILQTLTQVHNIHYKKQGNTIIFY